MNRVFKNRKDNLDKSTRKTCSNTNLIMEKGVEEKTINRTYTLK